jgi:hypothetical protein
LELIVLVLVVVLVLESWCGPALWNDRGTSFAETSRPTSLTHRKAFEDEDDDEDEYDMRGKK